MFLCVRGNIKSKQQQGIALILALLVVALVMAITVELSWRFDLSLNRAANRWYGVQAYAYLNGAEELAHFALKEDAEKDKQDNKLVDSLTEDWAQPPVQFPTDDGWVRAGLEDAQGRFNLNSLIDKVSKPKGNRQPQEWELWTEAQRRFIRLLQSVEIEEDVFLDAETAKGITEAVIDWLDDDGFVSGFGGAESDYYSALEPPIVVGNQKMFSVTQLNIIRGMTPQLYKKLEPLLIALPKDAMLNVNTMPLELMRTINGKHSLYPIGLEEAQMMFEERGGGYENIDGFKSSAIVDQVTNAEGGLDITGLGVSSSYFLFFGDTAVGEFIRQSSALIYRSEDQITTLRRTDANF